MPHTIKAWIARYTTVVLCAAAAVISYNLLIKHIAGSSGQAWFEAGCSEEIGPGRANCDAVLATPHSYVPPIRESERPGRFHIPAALLGLVYYTSLLIWVIGIGIPSHQRRWVHAFPLIVVEFGLLASFYYTLVMFRVLDEWCPWCLVTHILNVLIAVCLFIMWAHTDKPETNLGRSPKTTTVTDQTPWPSYSSIAGTMATIAAVAYGHFGFYAVQKSRQDIAAVEQRYDSCSRALSRVKVKHEMLVKLWETTDRCEVKVRDDDPVRGERTGTDIEPFELVVFSDFTCPACARFAHLLEDRIIPLFANQLRVVYKHYPLDRDCNMRISATSHPLACEAARMVEAARLLGGNESFWRAHDYLYAHQEQLSTGALTPEILEKELGLDAGALREAMQSQMITDRLTQDIDQAKACGAFATPTVLGDGAPIDSLGLMDMAYWDSLADLYWKRVGRPRPVSTTFRGELSGVPE
jgi:protein-disulfide isomerase/uncharacterized membrane protein